LLVKEAFFCKSLSPTLSDGKGLLHVFYQISFINFLIVKEAFFCKSLTPTPLRWKGAFACFLSN